MEIKLRMNTFIVAFRQITGHFLTTYVLAIVIIKVAGSQAPFNEIVLLAIKLSISKV